MKTLSENKSTMEDEDDIKTYWYAEDFVKEFIKDCQKNSRYANAIAGDAMSIPIYKLKELAGDDLI